MSKDSSERNHFVGLMCDDIDECLTKNLCPIMTSCANNDGSYNCLCTNGFKKEDKGT